MTVTRAGRLPGLALHLIPVGVRQMEFSARRFAAFVLVVDPKSRPRIDPAVIAAATGLTAGESRVAAWLAEGRNVREIAMASDRTEGSIRWTIRRIYKKQRITRQVELIRRVLSINRGTDRKTNDAGPTRKGFIPFI